MKYTLYSTVVVSSTYLILTLVILLSSIDQVSLEAHEVLGSPFILALPASFFAYNFRKSSPKTNQLVILLTVSLSVIMAIFFPETLGGRIQMNNSASTSIEAILDGYFCLCYWSHCPG